MKLQVTRTRLALVLRSSLDSALGELLPSLRRPLLIGGLLENVLRGVVEATAAH